MQMQPFTNATLLNLLDGKGMTYPYKHYHSLSQCRQNPFVANHATSQISMSIRQHSILWNIYFI